jgi:hypothetical protein
MLRLIFLLLLSVNLLYLAWQAWMVPERDPEIVFVSPSFERSLALAGSESAPSPIHPDWQLEGCIQMGPFDTSGEAESKAEQLGFSAPHIRALPLTETVAWWVMIPAEAADDPGAMRTQLDERGAGDYFIIRSGEDAGGVSLGLFTAPERAERRLDRVQALGFDPVIRERSETREAYWLIMPLGLPLPDSLPAGLRLESAICSEAPESLVTRDPEPIE